MEPGGPLAARSRKARPRPELVVEYLFGPVARLIVALLLPLRVPPPAVVLANTAAGLAAAWAIWHGDLIVGALLLQLKTLLDNADGQLARAAGRTSTLGRYLDTEADALVNVAVFVSLAHVTGLPWLALGAFVALTVVLSVDFNLEAMYREARGEQFRPPPDDEGGGRVARVLAAVYDAVFGPQDRAVRSLAQRRLERTLRGVRDRAVRERATLAYHDGATVAVLVNLGLSTQLAVLGLCLVLDAPTAYLWFALACGLLVPVLWARRERRGRAARVTR
jgi:archaetidylinositol phosphate synthase